MNNIDFFARTEAVQLEAPVEALTPRQYPQVIKYMGSKAAILPFIATELSKVHSAGRPLVDLFAGACSISGGFGNKTRIISNDIQEYSAIIASVYLRKISKIQFFNIVEMAKPIALANLKKLPQGLQYSSILNLEEFNDIEQRNQELLARDFSNSHHLFTKYYSGTWWSAEQCIWIDAIRKIFDELLEAGKISKHDFDFGLTCLMHAMAYTSQGTGHFAQYRDAKTTAAMKDISKYRLTSVPVIFDRKFRALQDWNLSNVIDFAHEITSQDYRDCLNSIPTSVIYADPPYAFVHYSRFYHALETICKYDYPELQQKGANVVKGRYRVDRHQSPFCIKTQVEGAFIDLFLGTKKSGSDLLLSYSNTGMINIERLMSLAIDSLGDDYDVWFDHMSHTHMTMGRREDRSRQVNETLIIAKAK